MAEDNERRDNQPNIQRNAIANQQYQDGGSDSEDGDDYGIQEDDSGDEVHHQDEDGEEADEELDTEWIQQAIEEILEN